jgi:ribonuclease-3
MSRPRLHDTLIKLFETRDQAILNECLNHSEFGEFLKENELEIPVDKLVSAFTHTSFHHEYQAPHQELLEFLGDSVLQLIITEELLKLHPQEKEGRLSKMRSSIVNEDVLAKLALNLGLNQMLLVGKGEFRKGLHLNSSTLADTMEALISQIYQYHGFEKTRDIVLRWIREFSPNLFDLSSLEEFDSKSRLQEMSLARYKQLPTYKSEDLGGRFKVSVWIKDQLITQGEFHSKKIGERELAREIINKKLI